MADTTTTVVVIVVVLVVTAVVVWFLTTGLKRVHSAEIMIVERLGKYKATLTPGLHWVWPLLEQPRSVNWRVLEADSNNSDTHVKAITTDRIDMREHIIDFGKQSVITKDTVLVQIDALVYFRITDARAAVYRVQNLPDAIELLTQATLRDIIAQMTLDDTFSSREQINAVLLSKVQRDAERWGVTITRVEIFNIDPPMHIRQAMQKQIEAERERRSAVLLADGERESKAIESRGHAAKMVLQAEGGKASAILRAKGEAEARKLVAQAEAQALSLMREAVSPYNMRGVDYATAVEYLTNMTRLTQGGEATCVLLPVDTVQGLDAITKGQGPVGMAA